MREEDAMLFYNKIMYNSDNTVLIYQENQDNYSIVIQPNIDSRKLPLVAR